VRENCYFWGSDQNSDIAIKFSDPIPKITIICRWGDISGVFTVKIENLPYFYFRFIWYIELKHVLHVVLRTGIIFTKFEPCSQSELLIFGKVFFSVKVVWQSMIHPFVSVFGQICTVHAQKLLSVPDLWWLYCWYTWHHVVTLWHWTFVMYRIIRGGVIAI